LKLFSWGGNLSWPWALSILLHGGLLVGAAAAGLGVSFRAPEDVPVVISTDVRPEPMVLPRSCRVIFTEPVRAEPEIERPPAELDQPDTERREVQEPPEPERPRNSIAVPCESIPKEVVQPKPSRPVEDSPSPDPQPVATRTSPKPPVPVAGNPPPRYPAAARRRGLEGTVIVRLRVDARGRVLAAEVLKGSGSKLLDGAALAALKRWRFTPGQDQKGTVESTVTVPVEFALRERE